MNTLFTIVLVVQPILLILVCPYTWQTYAFTPFATTATRKTTSLRFTATKTSIQSNSEEERQSLIKDLLQVARTHGQIGIESTEESQREIISIADKIKSLSIPNPSSLPLRGTHSLLYSLANSVSPKDGKKRGSASAGKLGPFVGRVTQEFLNDEEFRNIVRLFGGFVKVAINARREVLDGQRIRVKFQSMSFYIGGAQVMEMDTKGGGIWKVLFVEEFEEDGKKMSVRVMETPSLFVIVQEL